jgi:methionyl aminopeptidase
MTTVRSRREIAIMERASRVVLEALDTVCAAVAPGVTTQELDQIAETEIRQKGARPAFLGYRGYPKSLCVSVNDEVVHGIPGKRRLKAGDIVGIDCGAVLEGYYGDAARTVAVGEISADARRLLRATEEALARGIAAAVPGNRLTDIGAAVEQYAAAGGYAVVRDFVGHGIGTFLHEEPQVPNFGPGGRGPILREGMVLAIEPMLNLGTSEVTVDADGWTVRTRDGRWSAHFENTVAILADGPVVLGTGVLAGSVPTSVRV